MAKAVLRLAVVVVLPTPPLPDVIVITRAILPLLAALRRKDDEAIVYPR
jgi:hypothetical protein